MSVLDDLKNLTTLDAKLTDAEINTFNNLITIDKSIEFYKKQNGIKSTTVKVDLSKYDAFLTVR